MDKDETVRAKGKAKPPRALRHKTSLALSQELKVQAKHWAIDHNMTLGEVFEEAVRQYIGKK